MRAFDVTSGADTIAFNAPTADDDGVWWFASALEGWDSADPQINLGNRLGTPGQFVTSGQLLGRVMTIAGGLVAAPTENARRRARDRAGALFAAISDETTPGTLVVHDASDTPDVYLNRTCEVYCSGRPQMSLLDPGRVDSTLVAMALSWPFTFSAVILAPDPMRYQASAATVAVPEGTPTAVGPLPSDPNAPMPPTFDFAPDTGAAHVELTDSDRIVVLDGDMSGITGLTVDFGNLTVVDQAGNGRFDLVASAPNQWWALDPAGSTVTVTGVTADATLTYTPAWW